MSKFIEGQDRSQGTLFPEWLDDYVEEENPVRVINENTFFRSLVNGELSHSLGRFTPFSMMLF